LSPRHKGVPAASRRLSGTVVYSLSFVTNGSDYLDFLSDINSNLAAHCKVPPSTIGMVPLEGLICCWFTWLFGKPEKLRN